MSKTSVVCNGDVVMPLQGCSVLILVVLVLITIMIWLMMNTDTDSDKISSTIDGGYSSYYQDT